MRKFNATQQLILDAAKEVYKKIGYRGSTFQMLVDRSGISRSLINYYFPKKQDVLVAFLGRHLDLVVDTVSERYPHDSIMTYMLSISLYNDSLLKTESTRKFQADVLYRTDRDTGPYLNYDFLFREIIKEYNIDINEKDLYLKEVAIFGAMAEILTNYIKGRLEITFEKMCDTLASNALSLLKIPYFIINEKQSLLWEEFAKFSENDFDLF